MIIFCSDLDNTLIFSHRREIGDVKVCVEHYHGMEMSFMTPPSICTLKRLAGRVMFVPVTTRTREQYARIHLPAGAPEYALVCNGGILLHNGAVDEAWYRETLDLVGPARKTLRDAMELLELDANRDFEVRDIDGLFIFTRSKKPSQTAEYLRARLDSGVADVFLSRSKIYVLPKALNKGDAVLRLKEKMNACTLISAGDGELDAAMLAVSDRGYCPEGLSAASKGDVIALPVEEFRHGMLQRVEEFLNGGSNGAE